MKLRPTLLASMPDADAGEFDNFLALLEVHDPSDLSTLALSPTKRRAKSTTNGRNSVKPSAADAPGYVRRLKETEDRPAEFASVISDLRSDKRARVADVKTIANDYRGVEDRYKTRADALLAIEKHQLSRARGRTRQQHIRDIF